MIITRSAAEIEIMAEAGRVTGEILAGLADFIVPGVSTADIDLYVEEYILREGMKPAFKGYGDFPASACVSVNEEVIHGIPNAERKLREGDIVSVDLGTIHMGYYSDAARTYPVGEVSEEAARLIEVTKGSFFAALPFCREGYRIGDISYAVQNFAESRGFGVVRDFVGHGVGRKLHEAPQIPNAGKAGRGPKISEGMVLAIEPMITAGGFEVDVLSDNWTVVTCDGSLAAHYENTVVITQGEPKLLTCMDEEIKGGSGSWLKKTV